MFLQKLHVVLDGVLQVRKRLEVDAVDLSRRRRVCVLELVLQVGVREGEHTTARVMEDCDLARAEQLLRDYYAAESFFPAGE